MHPGGEPPADFPADAELIVGDVRDETALERSLLNVDKVVHLAAEVGVGQSMYAVERYVSVNDLGTAMPVPEADRPARSAASSSPPR